MLSVLAATMLLTPWSARALAELWRYVDKNGEVFYVDDFSLIPESYKKTAKKLAGPNEQPAQPGGTQGWPAAFSPPAPGAEPPPVDILPEPGADPPPAVPDTPPATSTGQGTPAVNRVAPEPAMPPPTGERDTGFTPTGIFSDPRFAFSFQRPGGWTETVPPSRDMLTYFYAPAGRHRSGPTLSVYVLPVSDPRPPDLLAQVEQQVRQQYVSPPLSMLPGEANRQSTPEYEKARQTFVATARDAGDFDFCQLTYHTVEGLTIFQFRLPPGALEEYAPVIQSVETSFRYEGVTFNNRQRLEDEAMRRKVGRWVLVIGGTLIFLVLLQLARKTLIS